MNMKTRQQLKTLQLEWYKKLKKSGFEDIEELTEYNAKRPSSFLKRHSKHFLLVDSLEKIEAKTEYYRLAGQFLYEHKFVNEIEKLIWAEHAEGLTYRAISKKLAEQSILIGRTKICLIVKKLKKQMLIINGNRK